MSHGKGLLIFFAIVAVALIALKPHSGALERALMDDVTMMSDDDPRMQAAFDKARETLDEFLALALAAAPKPNTDSYALKVAISHMGRTEYFWITPFTRHSPSICGETELRVGRNRYHGACQ